MPNSGFRLPTIFTKKGKQRPLLCRQNLSKEAHHLNRAAFLLKGRRRKKKNHQSSRPRAATSCLLANIFSCGSGCLENTTPLPAAEPTRAGAALGLQFRAASGSRVPRLGLRGCCPRVQESPPRNPSAIRSRPRPPSSRPGRGHTTMASCRAPTRPQPRARRSARQWRQSAAPAPAHLICVRERRARAMAVGRRPGAGAADGGGLRGGGAGLGALRSCLLLLLLLPLLGARWSLGAVARRRLPPALGSPPPAAAAPASAPPPPAARTVARAAPPAALPLSGREGAGSGLGRRGTEGLRKRGTSMERKLARLERGRGGEGPR